MRTLLLVDDDDLSRELLALLLEQAGWSVTTAADGDEAVGLLGEAVAAAAVPDCVLTDLQMPGLSGPDLAARLRQVAQQAKLPVFAMSGSEGAPEVLAAFDGFLLKPYETEAVDALLEQWLTGRAAVNGQTLTVAAAEPIKILDEAIRAKLSTAMPPARLAALDAMCLTDAQTRLDRLRAALDASEEEPFRREAHALKGSASMIGAQEVGKLASTMEHNGIKDRGAAKILLADLIAACERLRVHLACNTYT